MKKLAKAFVFLAFALFAAGAYAQTSAVAQPGRAGESHLGQIGGQKVKCSVEFTRPSNTTAYLANYAVTNSTSATTLNECTNFARVASGTGYIASIRLSTDKKSITPRFRVHFFSATGATLSADGALWQDKYADIAKRINYYDLPAMTTAGDTTNSDMSRASDRPSPPMPFVAGANKSIYWALETLDGWTPASGQKFTLTIIAELD